MLFTVKDKSFSTVNPYLITAQHAHPADRFAHETLAILGCDPMRSRRLMRNSLGGRHRTLTHEKEERGRVSLTLPNGEPWSDPRTDLAQLAEHSGWDSVFLEDYLPRDAQRDKLK